MTAPESHAHPRDAIVVVGGGSTTTVSVGRGAPLAIIAGPCVIESRDHCLMMATRLRAIAESLNIPLIFKSSYDKANRTSKSGYRGLGVEEGLDILAEVRRAVGLPVVTDVHTEEEVSSAAQVVDLVQIPAFLCRQTSLLEAAGRAGKPVMVKKGQFLPPEDMHFAREKIENAGGVGVLFCERGSCFGYRELVVDFRGLQVMRELGSPVVFDATHSVQSMGGRGGSSGGQRKFVPLLARAAVAAGVDAVFMECHEAPDTAPSDGPNMLPIGEVPTLLADLVAIRALPLATRG